MDEAGKGLALALSCGLGWGSMMRHGQDHTQAWKGQFRVPTACCVCTSVRYCRASAPRAAPHGAWGLACSRSITSVATCSRARSAGTCGRPAAWMEALFVASQAKQNGWCVSESWMEACYHRIVSYRTRTTARDVQRPRLQRRVRQPRQRRHGPHRRLRRLRRRALRKHRRRRRLEQSQRRCLRERGGQGRLGGAALGGGGPRGGQCALTGPPDTRVLHGGRLRTSAAAVLLALLLGRDHQHAHDPLQHQPRAVLVCCACSPLPTCCRRPHQLLRRGQALGRQGERRPPPHARGQLPNGLQGRQGQRPRLLLLSCGCCWLWWRRRHGLLLGPLRMTGGWILLPA